MSSQVVKLKRTAVEGKVPSTNNIELGELAINTYDGRIFFEKDNGTPSIQQVVTTNSDTTGSLTIQGNVTASYFFGDGSGLTNLPNSDVSQVATVTSSFDNQSSIVIEHNFNSKNVFISVYDTNDSQIIPQSVILTNNNTATIGLSGNHSGYVVVGKGGHIVSGTLLQEISEVATVTASFDNQSSINVSHNFNSRNVIVSVYDSSYSQLIPEILTLTDENSVDITLSGNHSGHVVVAKGGHFVSGSIITEADFTELTNVPNGLVSGSSQLTSSYDLRYALSGSVGGGSTDISSLNTFTSSVQTQVDGLSSQTSSYLTSVDYSDITSIPIGIVSGSSQLTSSFDLLYAPSASYLTSLNGAISSSIQILGGSGIFSSSEQLPIDIISGSSQVEFNSVNNTPFSQSATEVTTTKSIVPTTSTIDLGTAEKPFRDLYLSSASLYIDGQQVISSNASELVITTDNGQSIKLFERGADDIILQTEDGNIELKGTIEVQTGKKIIDSSGNQILFGNSLGITGSISLTGTVDGVNISQLKSDFDNIEGKSLISGSSQISYIELSNIPSGIVSGSTQVSFNGITDKPTLVSGSSQIVYTSLSSIPSGIVSGSSQITAGSTTNFETDVKTQLNSNTIVSGSSQILTLVSIDEDTMVSNSDTKLPTQQSVKQYVDTKVADLVSGSPETLDTLNELASALGNDPNFATTISSQIGGKVSQSLQVIAGNGLIGGGDLTTNRTLDVVSANNGIVINSDNIQLDTTSTTFTSGVKTKLNTDGVVSGSSQVSFSGIVDKPTLVSGSSQVISILSSLNSYTSSNDTTNTTQNSRLDQLSTYTGSNDTNNTTQNSRLTSLESKTGSLDTTNTTQNSRLTSIESATGSYETKGSGIVSGSSQVSYTGLSSIPSGIVSGSSQITLSSTTGYGSVINQAVLTSSSPTFAGGTFLYPSYISKDTIQGVIRLIGQSNDEYVGTQLSAGTSLEFYNKWTGGAEYSVARISGRASQGYAGGLQIDVAPTQSPGQSNYINAVSILNNGETTFSNNVNVNGNVGITDGSFVSGESYSLYLGDKNAFINSTFGQKVKLGAYHGFEFGAATSSNLTLSSTWMSITSDGDVLPGSNGTQDLGSDTNRWGTVYTSDLSLNNGIGDWTIVEGEDDLFIYNNKKGKVYKFALIEVDSSVATPKKT